MKLSKKAFTLVEMLIVVVIIGILAAALIPRLQGIQGRARDTKRKADLQQIAGGLAVYKSDNGSYYATGGNVSSLSGVLVPNYLTALPTESVKDVNWTGFADCSGSTAAGQYCYTPMKSNGSTNQGAGLIAKTEAGGASSNRAVYGPTTGEGLLTSSEDIQYYGSMLCPKVDKTTANNLASTGCTVASNDSLRYLYVQ